MHEFSASLKIFKEAYENKNLRHSFDIHDMVIFGDTVISMVEYELTNSEGKVVSKGK